MTQRHRAQNQRIMMATTVVKNIRPVFMDPTKERIAVESIYAVQVRKPFFLHAFVAMPDHCHLLFSIPEEGSVSRIMHAYKRAVAFEIDEGPLWQARFCFRLLPKKPETVFF